MVEALKARRKKYPSTRWIFLSKEGKPDNHLLRKLKKIALRAGLNCGQCRTKVTVGKYDHKKEVEVSCATHPVCEHFYLHRFRETCATRWQEHGIPLRTVQAWLGHKNLETTQSYLGVTDSKKLRPQIDNTRSETDHTAGNFCVPSLVPPSLVSSVVMQGKESAV